MDHTPDSILAMARSFVKSRIVLSAAELGLFDILARSPRSAADLAADIGADPRALAMLLDALAAIGLLAKSDDRYRCEDSVSNLLSRGGAESVVPMLLHSAHMWRTWSRLTEIVGGPVLSERAESDEARTRAFIGAMNVIGSRAAPEFVASVDVGGARRLLDVGGGSGIYTRAFLERAPEMCATIFDRPSVLPITRGFMEHAGLLDRVGLVAGDFTQDDLPPGHDLAFVSAIIHQNSPEENVALFRKVYAALVPGGRILVRDHVMSEDRLHPESGALFAINMLVATADGGTFTFAEIKAWLEEVGFVDVRLAREDTAMDGLVAATKP
jgi:SAM-dependent methyltransferase